MNRKPRKKLVLVLFRRMDLPAHSRAMEKLLREEGEHAFLLVRCDDGTAKLLRRIISRLQPMGAIYFEEELDSALLQILEKGGVRTVMCGGVAEKQASDMVRINDISAAYDGANYLLNLGHREILFLSDESRKIGSGYQRIAGCGKAMEERGLALTKLVRCGPMNDEAGYAAVSQALDREERFTAVFALGDELAVGAMAALYDAGLSVPGDVSVLGFGDLDIAAKVRPALTTIRQPMDCFLQKSLTLLDQPAGTPRTELLLLHDIAERGSCGPVNGRGGKVGRD